MAICVSVALRARSIGSTLAIPIASFLRSSLEDRLVKGPRHGTFSA